MSDFISRYEQQLRTAAERELRRPQRRRLARRSRRTLAIGFAIVTAAGVPAAARNGWFPFAGRSDAPTSTTGAPADNLYSILGVLRRPQTDTDRTAAAFAVKSTGDSYSGVQTDYVRGASATADGTGVVLIPAESHRLTPASPRLRDVICMWRTDFSDGTAEGGGRGCYHADAIREGHALQTLGRHVDMIVPDAVARVQATTAGGQTSEIRPTDNVASWEGPWPTTIRFYDDADRMILTTKP
jgi:hypothetical protein